MKRITLTICAACLLLYACNNAAKTENASDTTATSTTSTSSEPSKDTAWIPVDTAKAMQAWMEYATPGEHHKMLAKSTGAWSAEITHWMSPDGPPTKAKGSSNSKMAMDGRYQVSTFKGDFMGMPFEGMSITGYGNFKKNYVTTWVDNMGTGIVTMEGPWDEATKSMTLKGSTIEPSTGRKCDIKEVYTYVDDKTQKLEWYGPDPQTGKPYKAMEIIFTKK